MSLPLMHPLDLPPKPLAMGMPALGYECKVVDDSGKEVPPGTVGELVVSGVPGVSLMKGYLKNEQATTETLRDGWLHSGDQAYMDEDGWLFFVDRKKDMIKRAGRGERVGLRGGGHAQAAPGPLRCSCRGDPRSRS